MAEASEERPREDDDSSACVICCDALEGPSSAALDACSHCFHIDCIKQWANVKNECPLCKQRFLLIRFAGRELRVKDKTEEEDEEEEDYEGEYEDYEEDVEAEMDDAFNECVVCFGMDGEDEASRIDCRNGCGTWAHLACLGLPMRPTDGWYCAECAALVNRRTRTRGTGIYRTMARESLRTRRRRRRSARSAADVDDEARQCRYADVTPTVPAPRPRISTAPTAAPRRPDPTLAEISSAYRAAALRAADAIAAPRSQRVVAAQSPVRLTAPATTIPAPGPGVAVDAVASAVDEIMSGRRKHGAAARHLQGDAARDSSAQPQRYKRPRVTREGAPRSRSQTVLSEVKQAIRTLVALKNVSPVAAATATDRAKLLAPLRDVIQQQLPQLCVEQDSSFLQELLDGGLLENLKELLKPIAIGSSGGGTGTGTEATTFLPAKDRELLLRTLHSLPVRFEHIRKSSGMLRTLSSCVKLESSYRAQHGLVPALALRILRSWYAVACVTQEEKAEFRAMTKSMRAAAPSPARPLPSPSSTSSSLPSYLRGAAAPAPSFLSLPSSSPAAASGPPPPPSRTAGIYSTRPSHRIERRQATPP